MPRYRGMPKYLTFVPKREETEMRQLKGKIKENAREKRQRKKEFKENKDKLFTVVLPTLGVMIIEYPYSGHGLYEQPTQIRH